MKTIVFSKRTYILLVLPMVLIAMSYWLPAANQVAVLCDLILALFVLIDWRLTQAPDRLMALREVASRLSIGKPNNVLLKIYNHGDNSLVCCLKDDYPEKIPADTDKFVFTLAARSVAELTYQLTPNRRGGYVFGKITCRYLSHFRLFWHQVELASAQNIKVYPDLAALRQLSVRLSRSTELGELQRKKRGQGTEFSSLREYSIGDDIKCIDWKATARRGHPIVRTYEVQKEQRLLVLVDGGRLMTSELNGLTRFDHALNAALSLAFTAIYSNDYVGVGIFADRPLAYLPPRRGKNYFQKILSTTCQIEPKMVESDYAGAISYFTNGQKGRTLIVVLTDLNDPTGSQPLLAALAGLSRHLPFCVTLRDQQLIQIANQTTAARAMATDGESPLMWIYERAIATDLLNQRDLGLSTLRRRGCLVLDASPDELSQKLVDSYLEIKMRARL